MNKIIIRYVYMINITSCFDTILNHFIFIARFTNLTKCSNLYADHTQPYERKVLSE